MRIAYLTSQYPATSHTFIRREVHALRALGVEVRTFSVRSPAPAELTAEADQAEARQTFTILDQPLLRFACTHVRELARAPGRYLTSLAIALRQRPPGVRALLLSLAHFGEAILLAHELRATQVEHLHNHFANSGATVGMIAAHQIGLPWSLTLHGISEFDYPAGLTLADKIARARFVACVSYFGRAQAERIVDDAHWPKLHIVRCGIDQSALPDDGASDGGPTNLICVGRLSPEKGFAGLLDSLAQLDEARQFRLTIVGDGPLREPLERQVQQLGLSDRVTFRGRLAERETLEAIATSDALILPSFMEGLPVVLMEAMALGKPVIASRVAGIPELVIEGENGLLFAPSDWAELTQKIDQLLADPALRERLGAAGPAQIREYFDVRTSAERLVQLIGQAVASGSSPAVFLGGPVPRTLEVSTGRTTAASPGRSD